MQAIDFVPRSPELGHVYATRVALYGDRLVAACTALNVNHARRGLHDSGRRARSLHKDAEVGSMGAAALPAHKWSFCCWRCLISSTSPSLLRAFLHTPNYSFAPNGFMISRNALRRSPLRSYRASTMNSDSQRSMKGHTSRSSTPTLTRISRGSTPGSNSTRCSISDSTPPRLVAGFCDAVNGHVKCTRAKYSR